MKYKTHIDTVLAFRQRYMASLEKEETDERFLKLSADVCIPYTILYHVYT